MPLYESRAPSLPVRSFRSLIFDESLEIILESPAQVKAKGCSDIALVGSVTGIDTSNLKSFLKDPSGKILHLNETLSIDIEDKLMIVKGYKLRSFGDPFGKTGHKDLAGPNNLLSQTGTLCQFGETYICSSQSDGVYRIEYTFDNKAVITTLEYLYHMLMCV